VNRAPSTNVSEIIVYSTSWCPDCRHVKRFLKERGVTFIEINIDESPDAEDLVLRINHGRRKVPTLTIDGRPFACSPYNPTQLAEELHVPLNPSR
jgi:glutaredoxin